MPVAPVAPLLAPPFRGSCWNTKPDGRRRQETILRGITTNYRDTEKRETTGYTGRLAVSPSAIAVSNFGADFMMCSPDSHGDSLKEYENKLMDRESSQTGLDFPLTKVPN